MSVKPLYLLIAAATVAVLTACSTNTVQGVKQDAHLVKEKAIEVKDKVVDKAIEVKDKAVEGGKAAGQAVGSGLEKAGEAVKGATN
jgi:predicted small secreted protein